MKLIRSCTHSRQHTVIREKTYAQFSFCSISPFFQSHPQLGWAPKANFQELWQNFKYAGCPSVTCDTVTGLEVGHVKNGKNPQLELAIVVARFTW